MSVGHVYGIRDPEGREIYVCRIQHEVRHDTLVAMEGSGEERRLASKSNFVRLTTETSFLRVREQGLEENAAYRHNFCTFKHA